VRESLPGVLFRVELKGGQVVTAHIGRELRMHVVRILPGMEVIVEMSAFDLGRGRIVKRI
jgi:translation initiation factor IF-1